MMRVAEYRLEISGHGLENPTNVGWPVYNTAEPGVEVWIKRAMVAMQDGLKRDGFTTKLVVERTREEVL